MNTLRALKNLHIETSNMFYTPWSLLPIVALIATATLFYGFKAYVLGTGVIVILGSLLAYEVLRELNDKPVIKVRFFK